MYNEKSSLKNQVAVVTGGARNIGFESARAMGEAGARIALTDIDEVALVAAKAELEGVGIECRTYLMNVTDSASVNAVAGAVEADYGRIDIAVANAGICFNTPAEDVSDDEWRKVMSVNLDGVFFTDRAFARKMLDKPNGGKIINIASICCEIAPTPQPQCHYNASKAGVVMLTKSLATEWAKRGVRVNAVAPTYVETDITKRGMADRSWFNRWMSMTPMGRMGQPNEIASVVLFLASDHSSLLTGTCITADAGYTCW